MPADLNITRALIVASITGAVVVIAAVVFWWRATAHLADTERTDRIMRAIAEENQED